MQDDMMEIGETGLVPTSYGFVNAVTGEKLDFDGNPIKETDSSPDQIEDD